MGSFSLYVVFVAEKSYRKMYAFSMVIGYSKILVSTHSDGEPELGRGKSYSNSIANKISVLFLLDITAF